MGIIDFSSAIFYLPAESLYFIHNIISIKSYEMSISIKYVPIYDYISDIASNCRIYNDWRKLKN
jgi:hypothetical protein